MTAAAAVSLLYATSNAWRRGRRPAGLLGSRPRHGMAAALDELERAAGLADKDAVAIPNPLLVVPKLTYLQYRRCVVNVSVHRNGTYALLSI